MPPQHDISHEDLLSELQSHNAYFDSVVNMIPARIYVAGASGDDAYNPKYLKGQHKESKEARKARNKIAKKEKFDPEKMETTLEAKKRVKREMEEKESDSDDGGSVIDMSDGGGDDDNDAGAAAQPEKKEGSASGDDNTESYSSRIEMLRAKLHAKMAEKRAAAGIASDAAGGEGAVDTSAPALVSKRAARRAEKRKRQEAAKQRNKKKATSVAEQRQNEKRVVKDLGGSKLNAPVATGSSSASAAATAAQDLETIDYQSIAGLKPKLAGVLDDKSLGGKKKKKSLEKLLADAERKQARLRELKESKMEDDREKAKNIEWGEALKVAGGANTRKTNDPKLIKKALKRKAKKKAASAKAWNVRLDQAKDAAAKKQQIRSHNLESRKLGGAVGANLSSKRIVERDDDGGGGDGDKGGKKEKRRRLGPHSNQGRNRAGFEGKKSGFINGGEGASSSGGDGGGKGKK